MFRLALKTLKCDFAHMIKSWEVIIFIWAIMVTILMPFMNNAFAIMCWSYIWMAGLRKFAPVCEKMYHILPIDTKQRKQLMIYRSLIVEMIFVVYGLIIFAFAYLRGNYEVGMKAIGGVGMLLGWQLTLGTMQFAGYRENKHTAEVGFSLIFFVLAWIALIIVQALEYDKWEACLAAPMLIISIAVIFIVKYYFVVRSKFDVYKKHDAYATVDENRANKGKPEESAW